MKYKVLLALFLFAGSLQAKTWLVDPNGTYTSPAAIKNLIQDGDTIQIQAAIYSNHPQIYFRKNNLYMEGIGGRPVIEGGATLAANKNGKAMFVMSGKNCHVHKAHNYHLKLQKNM